MVPSPDIVTRLEDPGRALREARQRERQARVTRDAVIAALQPLVLETTFDRTNALTRAVDDTLEHPPEDHWHLDMAVKALPYRLRAELGTAVLRLIGEAWLRCVAANEPPL